MKRILAILFATILFCACVPTPEEEPVIHKNEGTLEQQLAATPVPEYQTDTVEAMGGNTLDNVPKENTLRKVVGAPETLTESFDGQAVGAHLYIEIDATVDVPNVEKVPVLRGQVGYEPDKAAERLTKLLIGDGPYICPGYNERARLQAQMEFYQRWIEALNNQPYGPNADYEQIREHLQYNLDVNAQVYRDSTGENDYPDTPWAGSFADAKEAFSISNGTRSFGFARNGEIFSYSAVGGVSANDRIEKNRNPRNEEERKVLENAVAFANSLGWARVVAQSINDDDETYRILYSSETGFESGSKHFSLLPVYEGIPVYPYSTFSGTDTGKQAAGVHYDKDLEQEEIFGTTYEGTVVRMQWNCPFTVTGVENENVPLLSFDRIMELFRQYIFRSVYLDSKHDMTYHITDIRLSYMRVKVQNSDSYYLLPVWDFIGYQIYDFDSGRTEGEINTTRTMWKNLSILTINAVDGSIIDRNLGY